LLGNNKNVSGNVKRVREGSTSSKSGNQQNQKLQQRKDSKKQKNKESDIWNMTETDEREKIREFWLSLSDQERANLIKMEKEAILQKMKRNLVCYFVFCCPFSTHLFISIRFS
jgi:uncharacterized damage-inducible protein DinB